MNDAYRPKVGDRVRRQGWAPKRWFDVEWVGAASVAGLNSDGEKLIYNAQDWQLWVAPAKTVQLLVTVDVGTPPKAGDQLLYWSTYNPTEVSAFRSEGDLKWPLSQPAGVITRVVQV